VGFLSEFSNLGFSSSEILSAGFLSAGFLSCEGFVGNPNTQLRIYFMIFSLSYCHRQSHKRW
jgi:hypothetical protein